MRQIETKLGLGKIVEDEVRVRVGLGLALVVYIGGGSLIVKATHWIDVIVTRCGLNLTLTLIELMFLTAMA